MRCFIAINLPSALKAQLELLIDAIRRENSDLKAKWVETENLHLTTAFLGEISLEQASALQEELRNNLQFEPFSLTLGKLGAFPNDRFPSVIKLDLVDPTNSLMKIFEHLGRIFSRLNIELEARGFSSHITLGRVKSGTVDFPADYFVPETTFEVDSVDLMCSELTSDGPVYQVVESFSKQIS